MCQSEQSGAYCVTFTVVTVSAVTVTVVLYTVLAYLSEEKLYAHGLSFARRVRNLHSADVTSRVAAALASPNFS